VVTIVVLVPPETHQLNISRIVDILPYSIIPIMSSAFIDSANKLADAWGPAITKLSKEEDASALKALCADVVEIILPTYQEAISVTVGDEEEGDNASTFTWNELLGLLNKDIGVHDYQRTESACLGVLGNRMILEAGRINSKDEMYMNVVSLITMNDDGKLIRFEAFADSASPALFDAAFLAQGKE
jgi:hypothetical protein